MGWVTWLFGSWRDDEYAEFTSEHFNFVALRMVGEVAEPSILWGSERLVQHLAEYPKIRARFADVQPRRLARHVRSWLNYYERRTRERLKDEQRWAAVQSLRRKIDAR